MRLTLWGPLGRTGPHVLEDDQSFEPEFQPGSTDVFVLDAPDVGSLRHIRIGHDSEDGWFLRKVLIERQRVLAGDEPPRGAADEPARDHDVEGSSGGAGGGGRWEFACHRWLDNDKDDQCSYRTIAPSQLEMFEAGDARQRAALPEYADGVYDSSLCLAQQQRDGEAPDLLASKYSELALRELEECPSSFTELLLAVHGSSGGGGGSGDLDSDSDIGRALLEALPAVFGPIDDDGDGEPGADDHGFGNLEVFDVLQSWVLRRTNIRPLTNVPLLRVVEEEGAAADADTSSVGGHAAAAMDDGPRKSESRACAIA